ncbi:hypothetical protein GQ41_4377 [Arenibacter algicola]|uniref:Uncharacterized protein n=1 Tax=Arenibacter algicola TaxID=616991 RepID=A0ABY3AGV9_9FLAO
MHNRNYSDYILVYLHINVIFMLVNRKLSDYHTQQLQYGF